MKKKVLLTVASIALVAALSIGGTLAFLTAKTDTKTNVFTGTDDNLKGRIEETFDKEAASSYIPGQAIVKVPTLVNNSKNSAYVAIKLTFKVDSKAVSYEEFCKVASIDGLNDTQFEKIGDDLYMYNEVLAGNASTPALFTSVTPSVGLTTYTETSVYTRAEYETIKDELEGKNVEVKKNETKDEVVVTTVSGSLPSIEVIVTGYMVQAENNTKEAAVGQLNALDAE